MNEKLIRYLGVLLALIIIFIGYTQKHFYYAYIGVLVSTLFSIIADTRKPK